MIARFIGGSRDGQRSEVFTGANGEPPHTWRVPVPEAPQLIDLTADLESILDGPRVEIYYLDGWYVRFSSGLRVPIYAFQRVFRA